MVTQCYHAANEVTLDPGTIIPQTYLWSYIHHVQLFNEYGNYRENNLMNIEIRGKIRRVLGSDFLARAPALPVAVAAAFLISDTRDHQYEETWLLLARTWVLPAGILDGR